jgi:hypothetical protein
MSGDDPTQQMYAPPQAPMEPPADGGAALREPLDGDLVGEPAHDGRDHRRGREEARPVAGGVGARRRAFVARRVSAVHASTKPLGRAQAPRALAPGGRAVPRGLALPSAHGSDGCAGARAVLADRAHGRRGLRVHDPKRVAVARARGVLRHGARVRRPPAGGRARRTSAGASRRRGARSSTSRTRRSPSDRRARASRAARRRTSWSSPRTEPKVSVSRSPSPSPRGASARPSR